MATTENQKRQRAERTRAFLDQLIQLYPECFCRDRERIQPLAIGMQQELRQALAGHEELRDTPGWLVRQALALYTRSPAYLDATIERRQRVHLDGSDAGPVSDEAVAYARQRRDEQKKRQAEKRRAQKPRKPRKPTAEERKQQKLEALARKFNG
ncbi:ProQ/FINO family protein [Aquisalimonas lutea]|uniref:ProQ/FINO family protein n=1 Tax=Aquisalimonas lutea TaxID=1327750 RepID=UPI0025B54971|nr:ProQ/FINO family protein [Aquisalimonas lutea]MDN3518933.1 ProQ/FINO family protein [Aquisalimonas lutea]